MSRIEWKAFEILPAPRTPKNKEGFKSIGFVRNKMTEDMFDIEILVTELGTGDCSWNTPYQHFL